MDGRAALLYLRFRLRRSRRVPSESDILRAVAAFRRSDRQWIERVLRKHKLTTPRPSAEIVLALFLWLQGCRKPAQIDLEQSLYLMVDSMDILDIEMMLESLCDVDYITLETPSGYPPASALHLLHFLAIAKSGSP